MPVPSPAPVRFPSGVSTQYPFGPLANYGMPDPFGYHTWQDDFDVLHSEYTATVTGAGTIASAAGDGGTLLFTTAATAVDLASIQMPTAGFSLTLGKKFFFACRLKVSSASLAEFRVGVIQKTATPFTTTDGIFFDKATGSAANLSINHSVGSVNQTLAIPTGAYTLADNTYLDLAFYLDRNGAINAFVGSQMFGWLPQAGGFGTRGAVAAFTPAALTAVNLTPTLAVRSGTASAKTMTADFGMTAKER
jgi:hypothetical protein